MHDDEQMEQLPSLNDWRVLEIDGEVIDLTAAGETAAPAAPRIPDQVDDLLVTTLPLRHMEIEVGTVAVLPVSVLNNGSRPAVVQAHLEGWIDERWLPVPNVQATISPGQHLALTIEIAPPRDPSSEAGDYDVAVVVRADAYPNRYSRLGVRLTILPYDQLDLDLLPAPERTVSWWRRTAVLPLQVRNQGNRPVALRVQASDALEVCRFDLPKAAAGHTALTLQPGQSQLVPVRVTVEHFPLAGIGSRALPLSILVTGVKSGEPARRLRTTLQARPLIGPWQMASATGLLFAGALGMVLVAVLTALFLRLNSATPAPPSAVAAAAPPVIVVNLAQPAAAPAVNAQEERRATRNGELDPSLPLVLPDQVTSPGSGGAVRSYPAPAAPANNGSAYSASASRSDSMTYAQMFQEVGQRYDLSWRMLAAQAYVESGFDSLALSSAGAMGLMQVLPETWREWAPVVEASDPFDSYSNVLVAAVYLDYLRTQYARRGYPDTEWMLVAYHWGPDRLNEFLDAGNRWEDLPAARRQYAADILRIAKTIP